MTSEDQEGNLALAERKSNVDLGSSTSTIEMNDEGREENILNTVYFSLSAENAVNADNTDEISQENGWIRGSKRRWSSRKRSASAGNQTEHTLVCAAGSSWFSNSPCDNLQGNVNEEDGKRREDDSGGAHEDINLSTGLDSEANKKDSNAGIITFL